VATYGLLDLPESLKPLPQGFISSVEGQSTAAVSVEIRKMPAMDAPDKQFCRHRDLLGIRSQLLLSPRRDIGDLVGVGD
jgi:hypothetical protein